MMASLSTLTGILLDVSGSMKENATGNMDEEGGEWARSIFKVIDELIKHDLSDNNFVFAIAVGACCGEGIFDIISSIKEFQEKNRHTNRRYDDIVQRAYTILEENGAYSIRKWAKKEVIKQSVSHETAALLLDRLECDTAFRKRFINECLPPICRDISEQPLLKGVQYMFSTAVSLMTETAREEDIIRVVEKAKGLLLKRNGRDCIVNVHTASEIIHGCVGENSLTKERVKELMEAIGPFIYGRTPLYHALNQTKKLFEDHRFRKHKKVLFVLSDGLPTDKGSKEKLADDLTKLDVEVVSCYITRSKNIIPQRLYCISQAEWEDGAKFLFHLSSTLQTQLLPRTIFVKRGWTIDITNNKTKLFLHVNHPDHLSDACDLARNVVCCQDALSDALVSVSLDLYINQNTSSFEAPKQVGGTCYANASAAVIHLAMKRILGREGAYPEFDSLRQQLIGKHGKDGAATFQVLQEICPRYRLKCQKADVAGAMQAITAKRPVVALYRLTDPEWDAFSRFYGNHPTGILTQKQLCIKRPTHHQLKGHAVVFTSYNNECFRLMNSWGTGWADMGFFRIKDASVLNLEFIDVYWTENDLTEGEKKYYGKHGAEVAASLIQNLTGLQRAEYTCPLCNRTSLVQEFSGSLAQARCPKCSGEFRCSEQGNILAMNMYLLSLTR